MPNRIFMKRIILMAITALLCVAGYAQELSKEEKKALKAELKAERLEQKRIQDSIWRAEQEEEARWLAEERRKSRCTSLLIVTPFESQKSVFDLLVHRMMQDGLVPAQIDKDYYIIRTARKKVSTGTYDITFSVIQKNGKVCVRAAGVGYGEFGVGFGVGRGLIGRNTEMIVPLEYGGVKGSTAFAAWDTIHHYLLNITHEEAIYELPQ